ncbi:MAG: Crp/Fnr family transcriptional regulator [Alphaproteobacteria bacterium]|nr:Crp/Fnr family transcriptional regulator [Alphaproteobacteria bacterium]MBV9378821.1 Crp/Fnr family transcriptional regulator [Alphaproteobacteria bacterium]
MDSLLVRKLSHFVPLLPAEIELLKDMQSAELAVRRHREIVSEGRRYDTLFVLLDGFAARSRVVGNGGRQILNIVLPGDFIGFPGCFFESALYSVSALTKATVSRIPHARLVALFDTYPRLAAKIFWSFSCEAAMYAEHLVDLGRRSALERVAHFLLELHARLQLIGLADDRTYQMPLTQEQMGDTLGLSVPHVNRTLRQLRDDDLLVIEHQQVIIKDLDAVASLAGFKWRYFQRFGLPGQLDATDEAKTLQVVAISA